MFFSETSGKKISVISPLPSFLTRIDNTQASTLNLWLPQIFVITDSKAPEITAKSALLFDLTTNQTLYEKATTRKMPVASLTKIMTAIIALENKKGDDKYLVRKEDLVGENSMGLKEKEILSLNELLYGLILHSGNDAAETIANNYKYGRKGFIKAMNDKAKSLGLKNTFFTDPNGLGLDGDSYSTPYDLMIMTNYALKFPEFAQIAQTPFYTISKTSTHAEYILENETNLLTTYPGVKGVKTGYTEEAGLCLITYLDYEGHQIIGIILNSTDRRGDMRSLLDYGLKQLGIKPPPHPEV